MKKLMTVAVLLLGAVSGYPQGQITFNNFVNGFHQAIYAGGSTADTIVSYGGYSALIKQGSSSTDIPAGTSAYPGGPLGGSVATGSLYSAQLLAAPGFNQDLSALVPVGVVKNFSTAASGAGYLASGQNVIVNATGTQATIAIAAWDNGGGLFNTLAAAQAAGKNWGISAVANITGTLAPSTPSSMSTASDLNLSFSLVSLPEPSTITLGVMGASALLFRRRK